MFVYRIDAGGYYLEPVLVNNLDEMPVDCVKEEPPDGLFKLKFEDGQWIEGLSSKEISDYINRPSALTPEEVMGQQLTDSELESMLQGQSVTELEIQSMIQGQQLTEMEIEQMMQGQQNTEFELRLMMVEAKMHV